MPNWNFSIADRYVDLAAFADEESPPFLVAEYVDDLDESNVWQGWQTDRALWTVVLFTLDDEGRLKTRTFERALGGRLAEVTGERE